METLEGQGYPRTYLCAPTLQFKQQRKHKRRQRERERTYHTKWSLPYSTHHRKSHEGQSYRCPNSFRNVEEKRANPTIGRRGVALHIATNQPIMQPTQQTNNNPRDKSKHNSLSHIRTAGCRRK